MNAAGGSATVSGASIGGFSGTLGIIFVVLKLISVIGWSWWWVLAPFWIPVVLSLLGLLFLVLLAAGVERR